MRTELVPAVPITGKSPVPKADRDASLRRSAAAFEASFLAEMLKYSGLSQNSPSFGGGAGEQAFAGFLAEERAKQMVARGGIGLAGHIFAALRKMDKI